MRSTRRWAAACWVTAVLLTLVGLGVQAVRAWSPQGPTPIEQQADDIASRLRCPSCQGTSVADSPSPIARDVRDKIRAELRAGRTPDEIVAEFVRAYGDWILLAPPRRGLGLVPWLVSLGAVAAAAGCWLFTVARWRRPSAVSHVEDGR